jgi:hypothetical protein
MYQAEKARIIRKADLRNITEYKRIFLIREDIVMKKLFILSMAAAIALTMTACGMNVGGTSSGSGSSASSQAAKPNSANYEDSLAGLEKYLADNSAISGSPTEMQAEFIGAKKGAKYQMSVNGNNNLTIELYEYDTASLNNTAKTVQDDVKKNGSFTIMNQKVPAELSISGKYLMVYKDTATGDQNKAHQKDVTTLFKEFKTSLSTVGGVTPSENVTVTSSQTK